MAAKDKLGPHCLPIRLYGSFAGKVGAAAFVQGLELTLPRNRFHFNLPENRCHVTLPRNRFHYTLPSRD